MKISKKKAMYTEPCGPGLTRLLGDWFIAEEENAHSPINGPRIVVTKAGDFITKISAYDSDTGEPDSYLTIPHSSRLGALLEGLIKDRKSLTLWPIRVAKGITVPMDFGYNDDDMKKDVIPGTFWAEEVYPVGEPVILTAEKLLGMLHAGSINQEDVAKAIARNLDCYAHFDFKRFIELLTPKLKRRIKKELSGYSEDVYDGMVKVLSV